MSFGRFFSSQQQKLTTQIQESWNGTLQDKPCTEVIKPTFMNSEFRGIIFIYSTEKKLELNLKSAY